MSQPVEAITYDASASKGAREQLNPRSKHYEFGGPAGTAFVTLTVPLTAYSLYFACSEQSGGCPPGLRSLFVRALDAAVDPVWWASLWDTQAALLYVGWYAFCIAAWAIIPGEWVTGTPLRGDRGVQRYKINGAWAPRTVYR
jgi:delta14-sterol reductase